MADMIKFFKGLEASLPAAGVNGALYITTDEGAIYLGTGTGMKRLGDFVQVANVSSLPAKAHESCLYYCVAENILAKWNGTEWKQINKQPTAEELKGLLGLGAMAYKSEVAEADLNEDLAAKINASTAVNHSHDNKDVLDGISAEQVAAWDAAESNAKSHADDLNSAMNTRVEALEAIDHDHANKAELDLIVSGDKAKWDDAAAKAHEHANKAELDLIASGDKAKWDAVVADHLTAEDKAALESSIKEAKKAGTDANTALEAYKVINDARVLAVEEDIAEIVAAEGGILAQAKAYSDGKLATARTEISAEIDADVKVVSDELSAYKTANDAAVAGVKATADAAATKVYTDEELAKKVDKVEGKSLIADTEIARLADMSDGANKVEKSEINGNIKIDGVETVVYTHPAKHNITDIEGLQEALDGKQGSGDFAAENHKHTKEDITDFAHTHIASEITDLDATIKAYDYATKTEAQGYADAKDEAIEAAQAAADKAQDEVDALEAYVGTFVASDGVDTVVKYIDAKTANIAASDTVSALADRVKAIEDDYLVEEDKTELSNAIAAEKERAEGIEGGLRSDVDVIKGDYLKTADKTELANAIAAEKERAEGVEAGLQTQINTIMSNPDAEGAINSINEFTQYVKDHGTIADGFRVDIDKNKEDIAAEVKRAGEAESALSGRIDVLEAIDHEAYVAADTALKNELTAEIAKKADATALSSAVETLEAAIETAKTESANQDAVVLAEAQAYADQAEADAIAAAKTETETQVKALADGAVATNAANIASLLEQMTWGEF